MHTLKYVLVQLPVIFVLENVKGLADKKNKWILKRMKRILEKVGYKVSCQLVYTKQHGVPQSRPRIYLVAARTAGRPGSGFGDAG